MTTAFTPTATTFAFVAATSLSTEAEVRGMLRPRVPNYALRRLVVGAGALLALGVGAVASVGLLASFGASPASASALGDSNAAASSVVTVVVAQPGDTLWSIAGAHRGDVAHGRYLDALIELNGGTGVQAGQAIWLP